MTMGQVQEGSSMIADMQFPRITSNTKQAAAVCSNFTNKTSFNNFFPFHKISKKYSQ